MNDKKSYDRRVMDCDRIQCLGCGMDVSKRWIYCPACGQEITIANHPETLSARCNQECNDATVDFELEARAENILYDRKNELMTWSMLNAKKTENSFREIKIDKEPGARYKRIDVADAIIDAHVVSMKENGEIIVLNAEMEKYLAKGDRKAACRPQAHPPLQLQTPLRAWEYTILSFAKA